MFRQHQHSKLLFRRFLRSQSKSITIEWKAFSGLNWALNAVWCTTRDKLLCRWPPMALAWPGSMVIYWQKCNPKSIEPSELEAQMRTKLISNAEESIVICIKTYQNVSLFECSVRLDTPTLAFSKLVEWILQMRGRQLCAFGEASPVGEWEATHVQSALEWKLIFSEPQRLLEQPKHFA